MANVELQIVVNDKVVQTVQNPESIPSAGEYVQVPDGITGFRAMKELFVGKVLRRYPMPGLLDQQTIVRCECVNV